MIEGLIEKYQDSNATSIISAIKTAADTTGIDFNFLMEKASAESNLDPEAKASTSSATGLFQFIDSTWLDMVNRHGAKYGLENYANKIECKDGKLCVSDIETKDAILNLRKDPEISSLMAAEFTAENKEYLEKNTDTTVGATELYLAHFMGAKGAANFINERTENGEEIASSIFTKEARVNKGVFYDSSTGKARSLDEVYDFFNQKFSNIETANADSNVSIISSNNSTNNQTQDNQFRQQGNKTTVAYLTHTHAISPVAVPVHSHTPPPSHTFAQAPLYSTNFTDSEGFDALDAIGEIYAQSLQILAQTNSLTSYGAYT